MYPVFRFNNHQYLAFPPIFTPIHLQPQIVLKQILHIKSSIRTWDFEVMQTRVLHPTLPYQLQDPGLSKLLSPLNLGAYQPFKASKITFFPLFGSTVSTSVMFLPKCNQLHSTAFNPNVYSLFYLWLIPGATCFLTSCLSHSSVSYCGSF